jgi:Flp pilus assembly protein TadB
MNALSLILLAVPLLLGAALLWATLAERRRQALRSRLRNLIATTLDEGEPVPTLTLRRRMSRAKPGLHRLTASFWAWLQAELAAAGNRIGALHLVAIALLTGVAMLAAFLYFRLLITGIAVPLGVVAAPAVSFTLLRLAQGHYRAKFLEVFPDALDLICRAVRAGLPVNEAMAVAGREIADPVGVELRQALNEMQIGAEPQDALQRMADRIRVPDFRFYVVALALQRRTGGGLAEILTNLSAVLRARKTLRLKARALSSEMRLSAYILAGLPFLVGGLLYVINPGLMSVLFTDPRGRFMLGMAFSSLLVGIAVMAMIIRRSLR